MNALSLDSIRAFARLSVVAALIATGWNFFLPLGGGAALRLVDICAAACATALVAAAILGWRSRLPTALLILLATLVTCTTVVAIAQFVAGFAIRNSVLAVRLSYLAVFAVAMSFVVDGSEDSRDKALWLLKWILVAGVLQSLIILLQFISFLRFGAAGAIAVDAAVKAAHLRDADAPLWWVAATLRPAGSYGHPNGAGAFIAGVLVAAGATFGLVQTKTARLAVVTAGLLLTAALLVTASRGAIVVAAVPLFLLCMWTGYRLRAALVTAALTILISFGILANAPDAPRLETLTRGQWSGAPRAIARAASLLQAEQLRTLRGRVHSWGLQTAHILAHPEGVGIVKTQSALRSGGGLAAAHNSYLLLAGAIGIAPAIVFVSILALAFLEFSRRVSHARSPWPWKAAVAVTLGFAISLVFEDRIQDVTSIVIPALIIGLLGVIRRVELATS